MPIHELRANSMDLSASKCIYAQMGPELRTSGRYSYPNKGYSAICNIMKKQAANFFSEDQAGVNIIMILNDKYKETTKETKPSMRANYSRCEHNFCSQIFFQFSQSQRVVCKCCMRA